MMGGDSDGNQGVGKILKSFETVFAFFGDDCLDLS